MSDESSSISGYGELAYATLAGLVVGIGGSLNVVNKAGNSGRAAAVQEAGLSGMRQIKKLLDFFSTGIEDFLPGLHTAYVSLGSAPNTRHVSGGSSTYVEAIHRDTRWLLTSSVSLLDGVLTDEGLAGVDTMTLDNSTTSLARAVELDDDTRMLFWGTVILKAGRILGWDEVIMPLLDHDSSTTEKIHSLQKCVQLLESPEGKSAGWLTQIRREASFVATGPADGPCGSNQWRHDGKVVEGTMQPGAWGVCNYLCGLPNKSASFNDLREPATGDREESFFDFKSAAQKAKQFFNAAEIPLRLSVSEKHQTVSLVEKIGSG